MTSVKFEKRSEIEGTTKKGSKKRDNDVRWACSCTAVGKWHTPNGVPEEVTRTILIRSWQKHLYEKRCKT